MSEARKKQFAGGQRVCAAEVVVVGGRRRRPEPPTLGTAGTSGRYSLSAHCGAWFAGRRGVA